MFSNREGFRETREELEQAGIDPSEIEALQRAEFQNARRLLRNFGNRALENINMLRMILNVDGDRNPEEIEANRVILFTRISSIKYDKSQHSHLDSCAICYTEYADGNDIKLIPKCNHAFHQECIESWILKARNRKVLCPVCRIDIQEELDVIDQAKSINNVEDNKQEDDSDIFSIEDHEDDLEIHNVSSPEESSATKDELTASTS